ncbi:tetraacyldisaccharide 4'-kinase [Alcanivorax marinus]|uniref:Tetraacyldisaccharide 4'-kinase n=1 Tax=Alloalcanivorax marinus TaxID=1177169 RepID=A0A9Q3YMY1_9GAMM|nr:tetraacyldisaccharide 4'-kinase [Alloalcanivorax marinus]MCC4309314.1 tetraacyldisaccharide 4'-kinase [Alloalcanivorax marinus]MCU5788334.1 tetraacyldisaccharide 4'-kinase [Alloalcanivorax marinus]
MADWARRIEQGWYRGSPWLTPLRPLGWLVGRVARRRLARFREQAPVPPVPVLVVGNVTVGGTGKTPLVIALARRAAERGLKVVVISRGYGADAGDYPLSVSADDDPARVGDEPLLIARRAEVPVVLDPRRDRALQRAVGEHAADLVISDDGLQHYALPRSAEVVVIDADRGLGNGRCLPAGPLREPASRLAAVDFLIANGGPWPGATTMTLAPAPPTRLSDGESLPADAFLTRFPRVHGVAGIGHPQRFFRTLEALGLAVIPHAFADHHAFRPEDLSFGDDLPVIMTEKDAVKCRGFDDPRLWTLPVRASLPPGTLDAILDRTLAGP